MVILWFFTVEKGSEKGVLRRGSEKGVSRRCLERPLGEYDPLSVHPIGEENSLSLTEFYGKLGEFCEKKLGEFCFGTQIG